MSRFVNFLLYQTGWFACVLGVAWGFQWLGVCTALCLVGTHLWLAMDRAVQMKLSLIAAALGLVVDCTQLWIGVFAFSPDRVVSWLPPPFMTVLWIQFATTFRYCMSWLSERYGLSAGFGLVGAPMAFYAGERFGAIEFLSPRLFHFAVLGCLWSIVVPTLVYISDRLASQAVSVPKYRWLNGVSSE